VRLARRSGDTGAPEESGRRSPPPPPPPPPPPRTAEDLAQGRRGVAAGMWSLARRKMRELKGKQWETATKRQLEREGKRLAREELAKRIEAETGRRPSERTLRRHVAAGTVPRGVDAGKMQRQAAIDNAGSIAKFAASRGMSKYAVTRWRDKGGDLPEETPQSLLFHVAIVATLWSKGERYKHDEVYSVEILVEGEAVARLAEAARTGDYSPVTDLVSELACESFEWVGQANRRFVDTEVLDISVAQ